VPVFGSGVWFSFSRPARRATNQAVYLCGAALGAKILFCRVEVRRVLVLHSAQREGTQCGGCCACSVRLWLFAVAAEGGQDPQAQDRGRGQSGIAQELGQACGPGYVRACRYRQQQDRDQPDGGTEEREDDPVDQVVGVLGVTVVGEQADA